MPTARRRLVSALIVSFSLSFSITGFAFAEASPDEQFIIPAPPTSDRYTAMVMNDDQSSRNPVVYLEAKDSVNHQENERMISMEVCTKYGYLGCDSSKYMQYETILNYCDELYTHDCISEVNATNEDGTKLDVAYLQKFPLTTPTPYTGDLAANLPGGGTSFLVNIPKAPHNGGSLYLITGIMTGQKHFEDKTFQTDNFQLAIYAVSKKVAECSLPAPEYSWRSRDFIVRGRQNTMGGCSDGTLTNGQSLPCVQIDNTICLLSWPLPMDINFEVKLKLHASIKGWLHGRLAEVQANISMARDGDQIIQVSGRPTKVPGIFAAFKKTELPSEIREFYAKDSGADGNGSGWGNNSTLVDGHPWNILKSINHYDENGFQEMLAWVNSVGNKATFAPTIWSIHTMNPGEEFNRCLTDDSQLNGIVTTNATMYIGGPPTFDATDKTLDYKVAAPHFLPNDEVFKGIYNLAIRSSFARCIYGFTDAPVSATVSVIGVDGKSEITTSSLTENNGWIYLRTTGFTFSSPVIRIKLNQEKVSTDATIPIPTTPKEVAPAANANVNSLQTKAKVTSQTKLQSITCSKGNLRKTITASKPKCPAGFKLVSRK